VPNLSPKNLVSIEIGKDLMPPTSSHRQRRRRGGVGGTGVLERDAKELLDDERHRVTPNTLPSASDLRDVGERSVEGEWT